jgi:defect-in-organelle-trafficking protein DotD
MNFKSSLSFLAAATLLMGLLSACESSQSTVIDDPTILPLQASAVDPDPASLRLAHAAEQASGALHRMSDIEAFRTPMPNDSGLNYGHPALYQTTSITWTGPMEQIVRTLSEMAGFSFKVVSKTPPAPVIVSVNAYQQPIGAILRDVGLQAGRRADVIVDVGTQTINLRFAPDDGVQPY